MTDAEKRTLMKGLIAERLLECAVVNQRTSKGKCRRKAVAIVDSQPICMSHAKEHRDQYDYEPVPRRSHARMYPATRMA